MYAARAMITVEESLKNSRRVLGYIVLAAGAASVLVGISPIFPVLLEAFVVGGLLIGAGLWILAGPGLRAQVRQAAGLALSAGRGARKRAVHKVIIDPLLPVRILKLARERRGTLTVAEVAMALNVPLDHAEAGLSECVRAGNAIPDYDMARFLAVYRFPEFIESSTDSG